MAPDLVTWGLQIVLVLLVARVWIAIDKNTDSLASLREEIPKTYNTRADAIAHYQEDRRLFEAFEKRLHVLDVRMTALDALFDKTRRSDPDQ